MPQRGAAPSGEHRIGDWLGAGGVDWEPVRSRRPDRRRAGETIERSRMDAGVAVIEPARTGASPPAGTAPSVKAPSPRTAAVGDADRPADMPGRRTVTIRGRGAERYVPTRPAGARRPSRRRHERSGFRPDRAAMWAVLLGVMLILAAATSAHAATLHALAQQLH